MSMAKNTGCHTAGRIKQPSVFVNNLANFIEHKKDENENNADDKETRSLCGYLNASILEIKNAANVVRRQTSKLIY